MKRTLIALLMALTLTIQAKDINYKKVNAQARREYRQPVRPGTNGINPKLGVKPRRFKLYSVDEYGKDIELVDEGTAAELASRNGIGPSTVYKKAGRQPKPGSKWRVEKVM